MRDQIDAALVILQRALTARSLYAASHPAVRSGEVEAHDRLAPVLKDQGDVHVMTINQRVVWDGHRLPSSRSLARELFVALRRCGADQITFRPGLERTEVRALLDVLAEGRSLRSLDGCPHLAFGHISDHQARQDAEEALRPRVDSLREIHRRIDKNRRLDGGELDEILGTIGAVVSQNSGALLPLLDTKRHDEYTFVHTTNVGILSAATAEVLGLPPEIGHDVMVAAFLHDVGKQAVPEEILNKQEPLTDEDVAVLRRHPVDGARMLFDTPGVPDLAIIVAYEHHIRADGGGYPAVKPGWRLNLASRIVQMADVFDALRTNRPYRAAVPPPKIREIMRNDVGTVFDSNLLNAFFHEVLDRRVPGAEPVAAEA